MAIYLGPPVKPPKPKPKPKPRPKPRPKPYTGPTRPYIKPPGTATGSRPIVAGPADIPAADFGEHAGPSWNPLPFNHRVPRRPKPPGY